MNGDATAAIATEPVVTTVPRADATSLLTAFFIVLLLVPVGFVFGFLGAAGRPAGLLGLAALLWWGIGKLLPERTLGRSPRQLQAAALFFLLAIGLSYMAAFMRPIDAVEARSADRGVIVALGLLGPLLLAAAFIPTRDRLDTLLRRLSTGGAVLASVGALQYFTGYDLANFLHFPLLTELDGFSEIQERSDLNRVAATTAHPIEFGVVLALIFPVALHYALYARSHKGLAWLKVGLIAAGVPFAVARSGALALGIVFLVMWVSWPLQLRVRSAIIAVGGAFAMRALVPGLLGTIKALFTNLWYDPSTHGRIEDYGVVGRFIEQRPAFGRGFMTFLPDRYILLDNQYLALLIETGIVGTVAFVMLFLVSIGAARNARRGTDDETRSLGQALIAPAIAVLIIAGTFDLLAFSMASGIAFLLAGCSGALWRLATRTTPDPPGFEPTQADQGELSDSDPTRSPAIWPSNQTPGPA
jgi:polysaccharide biosynthesis protein PslJ